MTVAAPARPPVEDPVFAMLASIGSADLTELHYQADRRRIDFEEADVERLVEEGHATEIDGRYSIVVPERIDRGHMRGPSFESDELIERIQLWALVTGRPPSMGTWGNGKTIGKRIAQLKVQLERHVELKQLYDTGDFPAANTVANRFGSMAAALVAAGFEPRGPGNQPQEEVDAERRAARPVRLSLDEAYSQVESARAEGDDDELHAALVAAAMAAFNEAEKIKPWDPESTL